MQRWALGERWGGGGPRGQVYTSPSDEVPGTLSEEITTSNGIDQAIVGSPDEKLDIFGINAAEDQIGVSRFGTVEEVETDFPNGPENVGLDVKGFHDFLYNVGLFHPRIGVMSTSDLPDVLLLADTWATLTGYNYGRATDGIVLNATTGVISIADAGLYGISGMLSFNLGNNNTDFGLRVRSLVDGANITVVTNYAKGGLGDSIVLIGMGEFAAGEVDMQIQAGANLTAVIGEATFSVWKLAPTHIITTRIDPP